jgi:hypothetical protein
MLPNADYAQDSNGQSVFLSLRFCRKLDRGTMLVTFVQGVVRSFDKHLSPLYQARSKECRDHAKDYLLRESGVHNQD